MEAAIAQEADVDEEDVEVTVVPASVRLLIRIYARDDAHLTSLQGQMGTTMGSAASASAFFATSGLANITVTSAPEIAALVPAAAPSPPELPAVDGTLPISSSQSAPTDDAAAAGAGTLIVVIVGVALATFTILVLVGWFFSRIPISRDTKPDAVSLRTAPPSPHETKEAAVTVAPPSPSGDTTLPGVARARASAANGGTATGIYDVDVQLGI